jgi:hypothetical protein
MTTTITERKSTGIQPIQNSNLAATGIPIAFHEIHFPKARFEIASANRLRDKGEDLRKSLIRRLARFVQKILATEEKDDF